VSGKEEEHDRLEWAFVNIPQLARFTFETAKISRLPGYTNINFRLCQGAQDWVLRLPREQTNHLIDRAAETYNQNLANQLDLAPPVAWRNDAGISLTGTLSNSRNVKATDLASSDLLAQIVRPFQRLHRSGLCFRGGLGIRQTLEQHFALLDADQQQCFAQRIIQARRILSLLDNDDLPMVPCHRDPVPGNLLLVGERLWLIDWEYSAMASPYWDLAILCNEVDLDQAQSRRLLQTYCAGGSAMQESTLFDYRGLLKLLNDCWMAALVSS
jgi:thiamine kinase-like enzyme